MKRREATPANREAQLDLPFNGRPNAPRSNGAEPLAVRIPDAVRMAGIGRSKLYELIASGDLETVKIGQCTLVTMDALRLLLARSRGGGPTANWVLPLLANGLGAAQTPIHSSAPGNSSPLKSICSTRRWPSLEEAAEACRMGVE